MYEILRCDTFLRCLRTIVKIMGLKFEIGVLRETSKTVKIDFNELEKNPFQQ